MKTFLKFFSTILISLSTFSNINANHTNNLTRITCEINPTLPQYIEKTTSTDETLTNQILKEAKSHLGKKYVWATRGPKTFDCSGFVYYVFKQFNIILSPSSRNQYTHGKYVGRKESKPGDLIFFHSKKHPKGVGHVGIIWENSGGTIKFIHASCSKGVTISKLEGYYEKNFVGIKRVY